MSPSNISINDHAFVLQAAREEQRVDGRKLLDHRRVRLHFHPQPGMFACDLAPRLRELDAIIMIYVYSRARTHTHTHTHIFTHVYQIHGS